MTVTGIVTAVAVGLTIGAVGRLLMPGRRTLPMWLTAAVGVVAAMVGTFLARLAWVDTPGFHGRVFIVQLAATVTAVAVVAGTAGRGGEEAP